MEGGKLVRTDLSPQSITKEILRRLEKSSIIPLCLEAPPTLTEQIKEMEQQLGENWTLEDIKGALMDDMRAVIQDELRQALAGLMPSPQAAAIPIAPTIPSITDAPPAATVPTAIVIPPAVIVLPIAILTDDSKGKPSNNIKFVPTMQMKKKKVRNARKKN